MIYLLWTMLLAGVVAIPLARYCNSWVFIWGDLQNRPSQLIYWGGKDGPTYAGPESKIPHLIQKQDIH